MITPGAYMPNQDEVVKLIEEVEKRIRVVGRDFELEIMKLQLAIDSGNEDQIEKSCNKLLFAARLLQTVGK